MDDKWVGKLSGAAYELTDATLRSYGTVWDRFAQAQEVQARTSQRVLEDALIAFRTQAERNLDASEELVEQARRSQEAGAALARESVNAYQQFLDSLFSSYREGVRAAEKRG